jgi:formate-dependent nitrite reductase cytochrome c552 subunit
MKSLQSSSVIIVGLLFAMQAFAEGFSAKFQKFVLGTEIDAYLVDAEKPELDEVAMACLNCHDGTNAILIIAKSANTPMQFSGRQTINHPVGMRYADYAQKISTTLRPKESLDEKIKLVNGRVSCISCHMLREDTADGGVKIYAASTVLDRCTAGSGLTMGSRQTDLCMGCHDI